MQKFWTIADSENSGLRLNKILEALDRGGGAWYNHPATQMWKGCEPALAFYGTVICEEWISRGYRDSLLPYFRSRLIDRRVILTSLPSWLGNQKIHSSHRGRLLAKEPSHYQQFHWPDSPRDSVLYLRDLVH